METEKEKLDKLIFSIEKNIDKNNVIKEKIVNQILKDAKELIFYGEWFVAFENILDNLFEYNIKLEKKELTLIKEILEKRNENWREDWNWIENMIIKN